MAKTYDAIIHGWVSIQNPAFDLPGEPGIWPIVLHVGERVWISGDHSMIGPLAVQVGDGLTKGFDEDGRCILSVAAADCLYFTNDEAEQIDAVMAADAEMMGRATG